MPGCPATARQLRLMARNCVQELRNDFDIDVRILGIMSSSRMLLSESSIDLASWKKQFQE
jgi:hypothetical protein